MQLAFFETTDVQLDDSLVWVESRAAARGAEYLVAAELSFLGYDCFFAAEGLRYDLIVDRGGLLRIQVKSTGGVRRVRGNDGRRGGLTHGYVFNGSSSVGTSQSLREYAGDADILAFVAQDLRRVMYSRVCDVPASLVIPAHEFTDDRCRLSLNAAFGQ